MDKRRNIGRSPAEAAADELGIRPLNARSVVLSALLGSHPPEMPVADLVELASAFGIPAGTLRTALSRMTAAGDVVPEGGRYRLAGRLIERQREQDAGRAEARDGWNGEWCIATATGGRRPVAERRRFRSAMAGARMGELRPEVWMRPANIPVVVDLPEIVVVRGALTEGDPRRTVERLWDLGASEARARELVAALDRSAAAIDVEDRSTIAVAFTTFAACLQFLRTEPQLPAELAPSAEARTLRIAYARHEPALRATLRALYRR